MKTRSGHTNNKIALPVSALTAALLLAAPAHAGLYQVGAVDVFTRGSVSLGTIIRTQDPGKDNLGGGNQNFDKWDPVSTVLKGVFDATLTYENYGAFVRASAWRDFELERRDELDDSDFPSSQKFTGAQLLDAYVFADWDLGDVPVNVRLGRQVLAWGESFFLGGGVNIINPIDVSAIRRAGSELEEALLPVGMAYTNIGLTRNMDISAFYQYEWEGVRVDQCGTYFATFNGIQRGCTGAQSAIPLPGSYDEPSDNGQYGVGIRYFAAPVNMDLGAFYVNYHSRTPFVQIAPDFSGYSVVFPEDIEVFGLSASSTIEGYSIYGEVAHRPDQPVIAPTAAGYDTFATTNVIAGTLFGLIRPAPGVDQLSVNFEAGYSRVSGLGDPAAHGGATDDAYGYRLLLSAPITDLVGGINLTPKLGFNHDVSGQSWDGNFVENRKAASVGFTAMYLNRYSLDMGYTKNWGGKPPGGNNTSYDRDFISVALKYDF